MVFISALTKTFLLCSEFFMVNNEGMWKSSSLGLKSDGHVPMHLSEIEVHTSHYL